MDNLNTHCAASLYETFEPAETHRIVRRVRFDHTPKGASWLNIAEIKLSVFSRLALHQRIADAAQLNRVVWFLEAEPNKKGASINWHFTTPDARIKLRRLSPSIPT